MKVTPIKQYSQPDFPTRSILDERPELLRLVPKRWQKTPVVLTALAALAAMMSNVQCDAAEPEASPFVGKTLVRAGLMGDVAVKPVIPTEEDARQVICEEAKKAGLVFAPDSLRVNLPDSQRQVTVGKNWYENGVEMGVQVKLDTLMDGTDKKHAVSYEYVSEADLMKWATEGGRKGFPDIKATSEALESALKTAKPKGCYKVFYAVRQLPSEYLDYYYVDANDKRDEKATAAYQASLREATLAKSREDLRAQVKDFIKWLKAQGVI